MGTCASSSPRRRARLPPWPRHSATRSRRTSGARRSSPCSGGEGGGERILALLEGAGPTKGSMLQDFEAGRRTEIDVINGAVVKAADETGTPAPLNRALVALVKGWESMRGLAA